MKSKWILPSGLLQLLRELIAIICIAALAPGSTALAVTQEQPPASDSQAAKLPPEQLDSLVAPIALYPDPLLSQTLVASTYPLEVIQLQQWLAQNKGMNEKQLADAVKKQDWDPSIQATGWTARCRQAAVGEHQVDHGPGQRISRAAERRDGCGAAHAQEGSGRGQSEVFGTAKG